MEKEEIGERRVGIRKTRRRGGTTEVGEKEKQKKQEKEEEEKEVEE